MARAMQEIWWSIEYLSGVEYASEIAINHILPLTRLHTHHKGISRDASIVHQDVNCSPRVHRLLEQPVAVFNRYQPVCPEAMLHLSARKK